MRDLDAPDNAFQPLGAPIRKPAPAPAPVPSRDGRFITTPDGKLQTTIPVPAPTIFDFYLHQQP